MVWLLLKVVVAKVSTALGAPTEIPLTKNSYNCAPLALTITSSPPQIVLLGTAELLIETTGKGKTVNSIVSVYSGQALV